MCRSITRERVAERLTYDANTGQLIWKSAAKNKAHVIGKPAGRVEANGYRHVKVDGVLYASHRLIWLLIHGEWPKGMIDHIDGDRLNNRISNLRDVDAKGNGANRTRVRKDSKCGEFGVFEQRSRWYAYAYRNGRKISLGGYSDKASAVAARAAFKKSEGENHV
ncbi:HNH endonuclease signature motif containing protein [Burkholderia sp. HI2500]|uniref:HNH endonuclease signature motif containing protein n=1 Tax=Burkholderia sp. HI2500 TaxID=2015358 RepID=UPI000B7AC1F2|nr:HNH endonuclease signature motif containing protein [Burkholderia sp. HI2500]OXJ16304.1 Fis family transcriptional regulator [Burkholderia sp. HI2500]